jgi:hypothetical protein
LDPGPVLRLILNIDPGAYSLKNLLAKDSPEAPTPYPPQIAKLAIIDFSDFR